MPRPATDKRDRLTSAALDLAYRRGFDDTSLAEIAAAAGVASGSVYYYFKTKDDVGDAIVEALGSRYDALMEAWAVGASPRDRLLALVSSYADQAEDVSAWGCPLGTVAADLAKRSPSLGERAGAVLGRLVDWCAAAFAELGTGDDEARADAEHLVSALQGAASLSRAWSDSGVLRRETARLHAWLLTLPAA